LASSKLRDSLFGGITPSKKPPSKVLRLIPLFKKRWYQECLKMCVSSKISLETKGAPKWQDLKKSNKINFLHYYFKTEDDLDNWSDSIWDLLNSVSMLFCLNAITVKGV